MLEKTHLGVDVSPFEVFFSHSNEFVEKSVTTFKSQLSCMYVPPKHVSQSSQLGHVGATLYFWTHLGVFSVKSLIRSAVCVLNEA